MKLRVSPIWSGCAGVTGSCALGAGRRAAGQQAEGSGPGFAPNARIAANHTTGPTRPNPPFTTNTTHRPRTPIRPPGQPATTRRAPQHALRQLPLDLIRISLYHEDHDASGITQKGPPRPTAKKDEGVLARTRTSSRRRITHTPSSSPRWPNPATSWSSSVASNGTRPAVVRGWFRAAGR